MNEGVQILLERMKTHPEEFTPEYDGGVTKWGNAIGQYRTYLTAEDNKALDDAWKQAVGEEMQRRFTQAVLLELVDPKVEKEQWGDSVLDAAGLTKQHIAQHKIFLAQQQAQAVQQQATQSTVSAQALSPYSNVASDGRGYLSSLFGGNK
jgi:hypothetical protein